MNKANECTCPSGDGSLVHPCPAHPAVEQAGTNVGHGHVFPRADGVKMRCGGPALCSECAADAYRARAALAQPSPAGEYGDAYQGAREDIAIWKRRALEAEQALRQAHNGQTFMGEPLVQPYEAPREKVNALFKVLGFSGTASVGDILDAALERLQAQPSPALPPFAEKVLAKLRRFYDCASDFESGGVDIGRHWLDLLTQLGLLNRVQRSPALWEISQQGEDLLGMPQPSPAQAEAERPEVAEVAFVLRNIGAMDAEDIDGDNVDLRFEDAEGRDTGCDVSIVEYAEKAADLFEQHDRIVGELRADRDSWAEQAEQRLADWDEMRKERDAALAEVKRIKTISDNYYALCVERQQQLDAALAMVSGLRSLLNPILCYVENDIERMRGDRDKSDNKETYDLAISLAMKRLKAAQHAVFTTEPGCNTAVELASHITAQAQHSVPEGVTIERDVAGTIHIKVGDFDFIQLQYQRPYTDNASTWKLAERIASLLAAAPGKEVGHE
ncbi:hypothetical protein QK368_26405 [Pseudomonas aeruginosa]|nr:hypothetical protein [Pseudomonas aeruginosa]